MAPQPLPLNLALRMRQMRRREPAHRKAQRQRLANHQLLGLRALHVAHGAGAVRDGRVEHARVVVVDVVLGHRVQQHIHVCADVHVAQLQRAGHGKHERHVFLLGRRLADDGDLGARTGGQAARERRVAVDVELEEVEEGVRDHGDGAVDFAFDAVVEFERVVGFLAGWEGDPFELVVAVFNVFAGFSVEWVC